MKRKILKAAREGILILVWWHRSQLKTFTSFTTKNFGENTKKKKKEKIIRGL